MQRFLIRRILRAVVVLGGITTIVFMVLRLSGDPVALMLPPDATVDEIEAFRRALGLDQPLWVQYAKFVAAVSRGDFGESLRHRMPALFLIRLHLPATMELAALSFLIAVSVAVPAGVFAAVRRNTAFDHLSMTLALIGQSAPTFWIGIMLILVFAIALRWLPIGGRGSFAHLILPAVTLAMYAMASIARLTRSAMLEILTRPYITTARSKGLTERIVVWQHALKNAAVPVVTMMGIQLGLLLGGAVVTETVFSWPGIGRLAVSAIYNRDYAVVQAVVFTGALFFLAINLAVDILYALLDPRIRYQ
jgi:peptide/nickel transport system permease protein